MYVNEHWLMNQTRDRIEDLQREAAHQQLVTEARAGQIPARMMRPRHPIWRFRLPHWSIRLLRPTLISNR